MDFACPYSKLIFLILGPLDGQEQLLDILRSYFHNAATYSPDAADAGSTYFSRVGMNFIIKSAFIMCKLNPTSPLFSQHVTFLQSLSSHLRNLPNDSAVSSSPDYMFFASFPYVYRLLYRESNAITTETGRDLILAILEYRERVILRKDIEDAFYNSGNDKSMFDTHWSFFVNRSRKLGIMAPPPAQEPSVDHVPFKSAAIQEEPGHPSGDAVVEFLHNHRASIPSSTVDG